MAVKFTKCKANTRSDLMPRGHIKTRIDTAHIEGFQCPANKYQFNVKLATSLDISLVFVSRKSKPVPNQGDPKHIRYKQAQYMLKKVPFVVNLKRAAQVKIHSACRSKSIMPKLIFRKFPGQSISSQTWPTD